MAMATLESTLSVFSPQRFSNNHRFRAKTPHSIKFHASSTSLPSLFFSSNSSSKTATLCFHFQLCSTLQEEAVTTTTTTEEETPDQTNTLNRKLYVVNLPWSLSAAGIKDLFTQCGAVTDVQIVKNQEGRNRGYAFVTMASGEEAQAAVDKFDSHEISGRIIRVELAKKFKKPPPPPRPPGPHPGETPHIIYASNLAWKVRATHLRQVFTENFKTPVSARVVFEKSSRKPAGYGFISFPTKEEAEAAISAVDGKELMGRPLRLRFSEKKVKEAGSENDEDQVKEAESEKDEGQGIDDAQPEES
ncbi:hypothetical protein VNO77_40253 [Canavalia gladiata]|uniref:RRM domain-containing protein n=1 Tax=Canavalia gladiata TaxID=3824 RepID=A0AAN9K0H6_CANGL